MRCVVFFVNGAFTAVLARAEAEADADPRNFLEQRSFVRLLDAIICTLILLVLRSSLIGPDALPYLTFDDCLTRRR